MAKVLININGIQGEVEEGCSILDAAKQIGAGVAHLCFGNALCSTCRVRVVEGEAALAPKSIKEKVSLNYHLCFEDNMRLSCQAKIVGPGPVTVMAPKLFKMIAPPNRAPRAAHEKGNSDAVVDEIPECGASSVD